MRRNNLFKTILILVFIVLALWKLYPTYNIARLKKEAEIYYADIENLVKLPRAEIQTALTIGELERRIKAALKDSDGDILRKAQKQAQKLIEINDKISIFEAEAIRRGLDLQGGTYLVYEVDFPQLTRNLARNKDARFEQIIQEATEKSKVEGRDFFELLSEDLDKNGLPLNRYFGKKGQSDRDIINDLRKEAEDAIDRTLEKLRNRVDQFGVSEPSIQKQGSRRIVIELAGIQDVERAKKIIGTTALLEFQLEKDPEVTLAVIKEINEIVKQTRSPRAGSDTLTKKIAKDTTQTDTTEVVEKIRKDKEVNLAELFGQTDMVETDTGAEDTTLLVDEDMFNKDPFFSLFGQIGNRMAVPKQNRLAVERILNLPKVQEVIPDDSEFLWSSKPEYIGDKEWYFLYLVKKEAELTGAHITNAQVQITGSGSEEVGAGQPYVSMTLDTEGGKIFSRVTGANVGKRLAIVLDGKVSSDPEIREKIPYGRASIENIGDINEAKDLAIVLRAGALPAPVEVIEERTVGPSLGVDSIRKGTWSAIVGLILVVMFMIIYYRMSGVIADMALLLNVIFILAVLAGFHATLTLPGVAGIILTIGMAIDANVLIFERIREELRTGKTIRAAIDSGYARAFTTILDANVTTLLTALVLYQFGTGPIRGFALTLSIGIVASMFTAIVVTRVIFDYITSHWAIQKLSI